MSAEALNAIAADNYATVEPEPVVEPKSNFRQVTMLFMLTIMEYYVLL